MTSAAVIMGVQHLSKTLLSVLLGTYPEVELLGPMVIVDF